jgi:hypothetical protein
VRRAERLPIAGVGRASIFSGATNLPILTVSGTYNLQALGKGVASIGDVDSDGLPDVAIGAPMTGPIVPGGTPPQTQVQVWSSGTLTLLYTVVYGPGGFGGSNFGSTIAGIGDVGFKAGGVYFAAPDGFPDFAVSAVDANLVKVYSGFDGAELYTLDATTLQYPGGGGAVLTGNDRLGESMSRVGDVDFDGIPDFIVGARQNVAGGTVPAPSGTFSAGAAILVSGAGGGVLHVFIGSAGDTLGQSVAGPGDVDGDGVPDVAIGAIRDDGGGGTDAGSVTTYSGLTFLPLWTTFGLVAADNFGYALSAAGDLSGDGIPDVVVGTPTTDVGASNSGSVVVLSGATGASFGAIHGGAASDLMGRAVSGHGDVDGDGFAEILACAPSSDVGGTSTGSASVVSYGAFLGPCAAGSIPNGVGGTFDMIRIDGSSGGAPRRVDRGLNVGFAVSFDQPPTFALPAPYYAFALVGVPSPADVFNPGLGIGPLCFPPPIFAPTDPRLFLFADAILGINPTAVVPVAGPAPFLVPIPAGLPVQVDIALTAVAVDGATLLRTNSILLSVR